MPDDAIFEMPWLQQLALDSDYPLSEADKRVVEIAHTALLRADAVELSLGGKAGRLGECIVETAFLEGMLSLLEQLGKAGTPVTVLVDAGASSLFDDSAYADHFWPGIHFQPAPDRAISGEHQNASESGKREPRHLLALDFHGAHVARPISNAPKRHVERNDIGATSSCRRAQLRPSRPTQTLCGLSRRPVWPARRGHG